MGTYSNLVAAKTILPSSLHEAEIAPARAPISEEVLSETPPVSQLPRLPYRRRTKRSSFEFYEDQLLLLKKLVYDAAVNGENLSQSELVRTALDEFLKNKR